MASTRPSTPAGHFAASRSLTHQVCHCLRCPQVRQRLAKGRRAALPMFASAGWVAGAVAQECAAGWQLKHGGGKNRDPGTYNWVGCFTRRAPPWPPRSRPDVRFIVAIPQSNLHSLFSVCQGPLNRAPQPSVERSQRFRRHLLDIGSPVPLEDLEINKKKN